jgi:epoxyqueuosine reductase
MTNELDIHQTELIILLKTNGASLVGFGDVSEIDVSFTHGFSTAISVAIHYDYNNTNNLDLNEELFDKHLSSLNEPIRKLIVLTEIFLHIRGYQYKSIPISIPVESNKQLESLHQFPHKTAATRAGLGWIGKSALLITPEYGPRVKLFTILTNAGFIKAYPINENKCGSCQMCVSICPCNAIKNVGWHVGVDRDTMINVYSCNEYRLNFESQIGRKHSCGLCIKVCKFGKQKNTKNVG